MAEGTSGQEHLRVKPNHPLADMIREAGLEWTHEVLDAINEKRYVESHEGGPELPYEEVALKEEQASEGALALLSERGLSPADVKELVAYASTHPQLTGTIVALGTRTAHRGSFHVFVLEGRKLTYVEDRSADSQKTWAAGTVMLGVKRPGVA